jgi:hypothetical protein
MFRMMVSPAVAVLAISCAAPAAQIVETEPPTVAPLQSDLPLARFMREEVNVPFSFMMLETGTTRGRRVHKAAIVLREAARDLVQWSDPPVMSDEGREVFYAYAQNLEFHVARLEDAAAHQQEEDSADSVEQIRQTCNHCHRFFRPTSFLSPDVAYDWYAVEPGGFQ